MHANKREDVSEILAGDIAAAVGLKNTSTGDTLCEQKKPIILEAIQFPEPGAGGSDTEAHYGNVQIEIGSNTDIKFQGKNAANAHLGLCMLNSSLYLDDQPIIEYGEFVPAEMKRKS